MLQKLRGFTIVELAIVISVLGILLAIAVVSWNSYIGWSEDRSRESASQQWASTFDLYKSRYFAYPVMPTDAATPAIVCLGAVGSFPTASANTGGNRCGQFKTSAASTSAATSASLATEIAKIGNMPKNPHEENGRIIYENTLIGPFVKVTRTANSGPVTVTAKIFTFMKNSCPSGFSPAAASDLTGIADVRPTSGAGSSANVCYILRRYDTTL